MVNQDRTKDEHPPPPEMNEILDCSQTIHIRKQKNQEEEEKRNSFKGKNDRIDWQRQSNIGERC